jgi:hypothetical protein
LDLETNRVSSTEKIGAAKPTSKQHRPGGYNHTRAGESDPHSAKLPPYGIIMDDESQMLNTLKKLNENTRKNRRLRQTQEEQSKSMEKPENEALKVVPQGINKRQRYNYAILLGAREKVTLPNSFKRKNRIIFPISNFSE